MNPAASTPGEDAREMMLRYLDGTLPAQYVEQLNARLSSHPGLRREFAALIVQQVQLTEIGQELTEAAGEQVFSPPAADRASAGHNLTVPRELDGTGVRAVSGRKNIRPLRHVGRFHRLARLLRPGTGALRRRFPDGPAAALGPVPGGANGVRTAVWAVAAGVVAMATVGLVYLAKSKSESVIVIASTNGSEVERAGKIWVPRSGARLEAGDTIRTSGNGELSLEYRDEATKVRLKAGTELKLLPSREGKRYALGRGRIEAQVSRQPPDRPMVWVTPHARVKVLGTAFGLAVLNQATRLDVVEGAVQLLSFSQNSVIEVAAGNYAVAAVGIELAAQPLAPGSLPIQDAADAEGTIPTLGTITREYWLGVAGVTVADLMSHPAFPEHPSGTDSLTGFETPTNWDDNYGTRIRGYLYPPATGAYTFWIAADDAAELWLSPDEDPGHKARLCAVDQWTLPREWGKEPGQSSAPIMLSAGRRYYIEALHKEGIAGDCLAVAWKAPGRDQEVIPGAWLSPMGMNPIK